MTDDPIRRQLGDGADLTFGPPDLMPDMVWWVRKHAVESPDKVAVAVVRDGGGDLLCFRASDLPRLIRVFIGMGLREPSRRIIRGWIERSIIPADNDPGAPKIEEGSTPIENSACQPEEPPDDDQFRF